jgi:predicted ATPase/DNA-binding winged helix-turn-helix (wHTH) protein
MTGPGDRVASFGPYRLSPATREFERDGVPLALGDRALDILIALVDRAGEVVSHRDLIACVWRDLVVSPGNLRVHMSALRKALGDGEAGSRYIENVAGQGYCFVAQVVRRISVAPLVRATEFPDAARKRQVLPPNLARMVGREEDTRRIAEGLMAERFITIIGPGGMGKTTVAIAVAHAMREEFAGEVCFVDLGAIADPRLVGATIASSLGVAIQTTDPVPTLLDYFRTLRILLVFDNCEHVVDSIAPLLETIFRETSTVHILATSREALRVEGEHAYWLPALGTPPPESRLEAEHVSTYPAVKLFLERATASGGRFELDDQSAPLVAGICGRLDGMALAIELAAARAGSYGVAATAELLNRNLSLDWHGRRTALPRHQTMRALLDWSYGLLADRSQRALRRLSVLVGSFNAEAACAVVREEPASEAMAIEILDTLVSKSLVSVQAGDDGSARFRILETTRIYAREKLLESGEESDVARRHAEYFTRLLDSRHGGQIDLAYTGRADALREHLGNVRAALDWCFAQREKDFDPPLAVGLAAAAVPMFFELSLLGESCHWSEAGLAALDDATRGGRRELILSSTWAISSMWSRGSDDVLSAIARGMELAPPDEPAQRLRLQATKHMVLTRRADFRGSLEAALDWEVAAMQTGDVTCLAISDLLQAQAWHYLGDQSSATRHFEAGFARAGDRSLQLCGMDQRMRGMVAWSRVLWISGFPDRAVKAAREAVDIATGSGRPLNTCFALLFSTPMYLWRRDWTGAQAVFDQLVAHTHWDILKPFHATSLAMQGATLIGRGEPERGVAMLLGLGEKMKDECLNFMSACVACFLAEGLVAVGRAAEALTVVRNARKRALRGGEAAQLPELLRVQAEVLLSVSPANEARAIRMLERSCRIARRQSAPSWELRSALALARIRVRRSECEETHRSLSTIYSQFTEGFGTRDLEAAARMLLEVGKLSPVPETPQAQSSSTTR